jgi:hypothetical protein
MDTSTTRRQLPAGQTKASADQIKLGRCLHQLELDR